jgi:hypothetical protein
LKTEEPYQTVGTGALSLCVFENHCFLLLIANKINLKQNTSLMINNNMLILIDLISIFLAHFITFCINKDLSRKNIYPNSIAMNQKVVLHILSKRGTVAFIIMPNFYLSHKAVHPQYTYR